MLKDDKPHIEIKNGRHPILTHLFSSKQEVVANNTMLGVCMQYLNLIHNYGHAINLLTVITQVLINFYL
jgi:DNA mismatch repair ATPase MutS